MDELVSLNPDAELELPDGDQVEDDICEILRHELAPFMTEAKLDELVKPRVPEEELEVEVEEPLVQPLVQPEEEAETELEDLVQPMVQPRVQVGLDELGELASLVRPPPRPVLAPPPQQVDQVSGAVQFLQRAAGITGDRMTTMLREPLHPSAVASARWDELAPKFTFEFETAVAEVQRLVDLNCEGKVRLREVANDPGHKMFGPLASFCGFEMRALGYLQEKRFKMTKNYTNTIYNDRLRVLRAVDRAYWGS